MAKGFVYVLMNPAMPGLVKVGKTTRDPTNRVTELSSATGVPTPFILVYQQPVIDCDLVEVQVHKELERLGHRLTDNREFFNAPIHIITQTIINIASQIDTDYPSEAIADANIENQYNSLADELYELAIDHAEGTSEVLIDELKAHKLFVQAAELGHAGAITRAAHNYQYGIGVSQNNQKALDLYKVAVKKGDWGCESAIAEIFLRSGQREASEEHWVNFFAHALRDLEFGINVELATLKISCLSGNYAWLVVNNKISHCVDNATISKMAGPLNSSIKDLINSLQGQVNNLNNISVSLLKFIDNCHTDKETLPPHILKTSEALNNLSIAYINEKKHRSNTINNRIRLYEEYGFKYLVDEYKNEIPVSSQKHPDFYNAMKNTEFCRRLNEINAPF